MFVQAVEVPQEALPLDRQTLDLPEVEAHLVVDYLHFPHQALPAGSAGGEYSTAGYNSARSRASYV